MPVAFAIRGLRFRKSVRRIAPRNLRLLDQDLGPCRAFLIDGWKGYEWRPQTKDGPARLVEFGRLHLEGTEIPGRHDKNQTSADMFKLMEKAQYDHHGEGV